MAHNKFFDVISYEMDNETLVHRSEIDNFNFKSQLVVAESQEAVFFKDGKALDLFGPGRHSLNSDNVPLLRGVFEKFFNKKTIFTCSVFFINKTIPLDMKWGTDSPIEIMDPVYGIQLHVGAFGQMGVRIADSRKFLAKCSGQLRTFTNDDISRYIKGALMQVVKQKIAEIILLEKVSIKEVPLHLDKIASRIQEKLADEFDYYGLECAKFYIMNIRPADDDMKHLEYIIEKRYKGEGDKAYREIQGYNYQEERQFNVLEEAAKNTGAGNAMAPGLGIGMGLGIGRGVSNAMADTTNEVLGKPGAKTAPGMKCPKCGQDVPAGAKFCPNCGEKMNVQKFCPNCGKPLTPGAKFCSECGQKVE